MKSGKSSAAGGLKVVIALILVAFIVALGYNFIKRNDDALGEIKSFALVQSSTEDYILKDTANVEIVEEETFYVKHFTGDDKIEASLEAIAVADDYAFTITRTIQGKAVPLSYTWNGSIVGTGEGDELAKCFDVSVDQSADTVTLKGTLGSALSIYAGQIGGTAKLPALPDADLLQLKIKSGGSTITLGLRISANVGAVALSQNDIVLRR